MDVTNHSLLEQTAFARIQAVAAIHHQLLDVLNCNEIAKDNRLALQVVTQDEYTHDVIVEWGDGAFLVYDTN